MNENGDDIVAQLKNLATKMFKTGNWGEDLETIKAAIDTIVNLRALAAIEEPAAWQDTANHMEIVSAEDWKNIDPMWHWMYRPLYPSPPKREWVGLTDEERAVIVEANTFDDHGYDIWCSGDWVARAVESKLKDKNT